MTISEPLLYKLQYSLQLPRWPDVFLKPFNEENVHQRCLSSSPTLSFFLTLLCSFPLVYAFASVLMWYVVTMVSNVSDSLDAWHGMLLHAHTAFTNATQSRRNIYMHMHIHTHVYTQTNLESHALSKRLCMHVCVPVYKAYACKSAKWCISGRNSCSFLHEKRNFLLPRCKPRPVSQDINQSAMLRLNAGS